MESEIDQKPPKPPVDGICELDRDKTLSAIVSDSVDITEPACMEKVLFYLEKIQLEDDVFMTMLFDSVEHNMDIPWERPWYQQTKSITRPIKDDCHDDTDMYRTDSFDSDEIKAVKKNWKKFRKLYQLPDTPICFARWRNKRSKHPKTHEEQVRKYVTAFLARGLQRSLFQVYRHILSYFGGPVKGPYSPVEKQIMKICFHHDPKQAVPSLSMILSREPRGIYKILRKEHHGISEKTFNKKKWTLEDKTKLVNLLMTYNQCSLEELKNKWFDVSIWLKIQDDFHHPYIFIQRFWYHQLHTQIFVKGDVKIKRLRRKILKRLNTMPYKKYFDIRWKEVAKYFPDGFTHYFIHTTAREILRQCPGYYSKKPLEEVITSALEKLTTSKERRLKTLQMDKNGELNYVRYDETLKL